MVVHQFDFQYLSVDSTSSSLPVKSSNFVPRGSQTTYKPRASRGGAFLVERLVEFLLYNPDFFPVLYTG